MTRTTRPDPIRRAAQTTLKAVASKSVIETLEGRRLLAAPQLAAVPSLTVPAEHTIQVPINAFDADGETLSFSVTSDTGTLVPSLRAAPGNTFLEMEVTWTENGGLRGGNLVFALFDEATPLTVDKIAAFADTGLYDGLSFHRVIEGFVNQGGDPAGDGTGDADKDGTGDFNPIEFEDEFQPEIIFSGEGQLAMANRGKDTNTTQFFVTDGPQRLLDYNHTIFGQLVSGFDVNRAINAVPTDGNGRPVNPVTISYARTVERPFDAVVQVRSTGALTTGNIVVTATDPTGQAASVSFPVTAVRDTNPAGQEFDQPPILGELQRTYYTPADTPITIPISAFDPEGDSWEIGGEFITSFTSLNAPETDIDQEAKTVTFDPADGYVGPIEVRIGVKQAGATSRGSTGQSQNILGIFDSAPVTIAVGEGRLALEPATVRAVPDAAVPDALLATFTDLDPNGSVDDWTALVDYGDGTFDENATIVDLGGGSYEVRGPVGYPLPTDVPVTVTVTGSNGATESVVSRVEVRQRSVIERGRLVISGTDDDDIIGVTRQGEAIRVFVNDRFEFHPVSAVGLLDIDALGGNDYVEIGGGVIGGIIRGGPGNDILYGGEDNDVIYGGEDKDYILANGGDDLVFGDGGDDIVSGGAGKNTLNGGDGNDRLNGSGGRDLLNGDANDDRLYGRGGDDTLNGNSGVDRLFGDNPSDTPGNDVLSGGSSNDKLYGRGGDDIFFGGKGRDLFSGGDGNDTANVDDEDNTDPASGFFSSIEIVL